MAGKPTEARPAGAGAASPARDRGEPVQDQGWDQDRDPEQVQMQEPHQGRDQGQERAREQRQGRDQGPDGQTTVPDDTPNDPATDESPKERVDRELMELLNELRVVLPGIQVLFAFLLTVPFSQRFQDVSPPEKAAFFLAVLSTAAATIALVTVPNYHRLTFRSATKERLLHVGNALALVGTGFLGVAIVAVLFVLTDFLYDGAGVAVVTVVAAVIVVALWFVLPTMSRVRKQRRPRPPGEGPLT